MNRCLLGKAQEYSLNSDDWFGQIKGTHLSTAHLDMDSMTNCSKLSMSSHAHWLFMNSAAPALLGINCTLSWSWNPSCYLHDPSVYFWLKGRFRWSCSFLLCSTWHFLLFSQKDSKDCHIIPSYAPLDLWNFWFKFINSDLSGHGVIFNLFLIIKLRIVLITTGLIWFT